MEIYCDFCLSRKKEEDCQKVKELVIDKSPGFIQFPAILKIIFGVSVEATNICQECFDSVLSHYTFREKVFKNLKLSNDASNPIHTHVKKYLNEINEPASVVIHQEILSIVPNSLKRRHQAQLSLQEAFSPSTVVYDCSKEIDALKQRIKEEAEAHQRSVKVAEELETGIFGDDDYYVSLQHLNDTSTPSTSRSTRNKPQKTASNVQQVQINNDEDLDTSGESSNEAQSTSYAPAKRKGKVQKGPPQKRAKIVSQEITEAEGYQDPLTFETIEVKTERVESPHPVESSELLIERSHDQLNSSRLKRQYNTTDPELDDEQNAKLKELIKKSRRGIRGGVKIYQCHECNKVLKTLPSAKYHIKNLHILEKKPPVKQAVKDEKRERFDFTLSKEQNDKMDEMIRESNLGDKFQCSSCHKVLKSIHALKYHIKYRHILSTITNEVMWISKHVKEGKQEINDGGVIKYEWQCSMCDNVSYTSHQAFRAHMKTHYTKLFKNENSKEFIDMMVSTMGSE